MKRFLADPRRSAERADEVLPENAVCEIKIPVSPSASERARMMTHAPFEGRTAFVIGDDVTDESVFEKLRITTVAFSLGRAAGRGGSFRRAERRARVHRESASTMAKP